MPVSIQRIFLLMLSLIGLSGVVSAADNLLKNGDFTDGTSHWSVVTKQPTKAVELAVGDMPGIEDVGGEKPTVNLGGDVNKSAALQVDIAKDGGNNYGEIRQKVKARANHLYRLTFKIRSTKDSLAFVQVKLRENGQEKKRISSKKSTTDWKTMSVEFDSKNADEIQVLCRYRQSEKHNWVGEAAWFADLQLVDLGRNPEAAPKAELSQGAAAMLAANSSQDVPTAKATGTDIYVTPQGAGNMDGTSWENARPGNGDGALQAAWDSAGLGRSCFIGSGTYVGQRLSISEGGSDGNTWRKLIGVDTGDGLPIFRNTFDRQNPSSGKTFIEIAEDTNFIWIENINVHNYKIVSIARGRNKGFRLLNVDVKDVRDCFILVGGARETDHVNATREVLIKDCDVIGFTKRAVRISGGVYNAQIVNVNADAGGKAHATERFQMAFHLEGGSGGIADHDITFINCEARNAYDDNGDGYWNADGFAAERNTYNITYINCRAFDCTDGGWDVKTSNPTLINCIALRNKRNFRFWSRGGATLINCLGANAIKRGGTGTAAGLHVCGGAVVTAIDSTFANNGIQVDVDKSNHGNPACHAELIDCILSKDADIKGHMVTTEEHTTATLVNTITFDGSDETTNPKLHNADKEWEGQGAAFHSTVYEDKGFRASE